MSSHLSRRDPDEAEFDAAIAEFHDGSDRVAAIMGAAIIENTLVAALRSALDDPSDEASLFHEQGAPFGTFRTRIVAAKAMGLLRGSMVKDLEIIRDVRNQFAHALLSINFANLHIQEVVEKMDDWPYHANPNRSVDAVRGRFERACWSISLHLLKQSNRNLDAKEKKLRHAARIGDLIASGLKARVENVEGDGIAS